MGAENGFDPAHAYMHRNSALIRGFKVPTVLGDADLDEGGMEIINADRKQPGPTGVKLIRGVGRPIWETEVVRGKPLRAR